MISTASLRFSGSLLALLTIANIAYAADPAPAASENWWDGKLAGNLSFASDYTYRGVSQTQEAPAAQASLEYLTHSGVKLGIWASNVDFADASLETDLYASYPITSGQWTFEPGFIYYAYPGADASHHYDYYEFNASLGYDFGPFSLTGSLYVSPNTFGDSGLGTSARLTAKAPITEKIALEGWVGHQTEEDKVKFGLPNYTDWALAVSYTIQQATLKLQYVDTDLARSQCPDGCDAKLVASVSYAF